MSALFNIVVTGSSRGSFDPKGLPLQRCDEQTVDLPRNMPLQRSRLSGIQQEEARHPPSPLRNGPFFPNKPIGCYSSEDEIEDISTSLCKSVSSMDGNTNNTHPNELTREACQRSMGAVEIDSEKQRQESNNTNTLQNSFGQQHLTEDKSKPSQHRDICSHREPQNKACMSIETSQNQNHQRSSIDCLPDDVSQDSNVGSSFELFNSDAKISKLDISKELKSTPHLKQKHSVNIPLLVSPRRRSSYCLEVDLDRFAGDGVGEAITNESSHHVDTNPMAKGKWVAAHNVKNENQTLQQARVCTGF